MEIAGLRNEIDSFIAAGKAIPAAASLTELWSQSPGPATAGFVVSRYEVIRERLALKPYRVAILRSFTVEPLLPLLRAASFTLGVDLTIHLGDFNVYWQEMLDGSSPLYAFAPDAVILAVQTRDLAPELWNNYGGLSQEAVHVAVDRVTGSFRDGVRAFRNYSNASLVIHSLEQPAILSRGVMDAQTECGQARAIRQINNRIRKIAAEEKGVYLLDYDALVARYGRLGWHDERKWLTARLPIAAPHLVHLTGEWLRFIAPLAGKVAKAAVIDLDNTLWGGVIGEDGIEGIKTGPEYPGAAYQELQRAFLDLSQRGILLAICSKNNPEDALEALEKHPGMLLRPSHFAALRINWNDKSQNLREIAQELNIGMDALAFVDDNAAERQQIRSAALEVTVIPLPEDPMGFAAAVREHPVFQRLAFSEEDQKRNTYYAAERERKQSEQTFSTKEDFYASLEQEVEIAPVGRATLTRVAQLTQKTNQFNLTTRRYTEQQIAATSEAPGCEVWSLRVRDRFGDNGLVGVAITRSADGVCEIDTFLLSCRVIGRTVETAFLARLAERAREKGAQKMQGWFLPTKKNAPARGFYADHKFTVQKQEDDRLLWELDLAQGGVAFPKWIKLVPEAGGQG